MALVRQICSLNFKEFDKTSFNIEIEEHSLHLCHALLVDTIYLQYDTILHGIPIPKYNRFSDVVTTQARSNATVLLMYNCLQRRTLLYNELIVISYQVTCNEHIVNRWIFFNQTKDKFRLTFRSIIFTL